MENQFSAGCGRVNVFREAFKPDLSVIQLSDRFNEVFEGAS